MGVKPQERVAVVSEKEKEGSGSTSSIVTETDLGITSEEEGLGKKGDF